MEEPESCDSQPPANTVRPSRIDDEQEHDKFPYILHLPDHIIVEIFCKVPTKTLIQCRAVCKPWLRWLSDREFTKSLFSRTPTCILLHCQDINSAKGTGHFLVGLNEDSSPNGDVIKISRDFSTDYGLSVKIVGSCNGLLCLDDGRRNFGHLCISNPITGEFLTLPTPTEDERIGPSVCGFGFSPISDGNSIEGYDEKEVMLYDEKEVMVLTVGSGNWRSIGNSISPVGNQMYGVYFNGFLHWVGNRFVLICAFDVESEHFQELPPPPCPSDLQKSFCGLILVVLRGCLSMLILTGYDLNVWVMKDYGVGETWTKELVIRDVVGYDVPRIVKFSVEGQIWLIHDLRLRAITPGKVYFLKVVVDGIPLRVGRAYTHIPSFVSLRDVIGFRG